MLQGNIGLYNFCYLITASLAWFKNMKNFGGGLFRVRAVNETGVSDYSNVISVTTR